MTGMSKQNSIRRRWREGPSAAEIARDAEASRDTVHECRDKADFSPSAPATGEHASKPGSYRALIDQWLDDDARSGFKQRHTAKRVHDRLVEEEGAHVSPSTVGRYVRKAKEARPAQRERFLDLVWAPGEAQADFHVRGIGATLKYFVVAFPFSNVGLAQVSPGEDAECACQGLRSVFEYVGGVPTRVVFDSAAGVGRKTCDIIRATRLSEACGAHYGFAYRLCNPHSGHEKGDVENEVGTIRRNLFVPVPQVWNADTSDLRLLDKRTSMADEEHWIKGEPERQLFEEGRLALLGLPEKPFGRVTYVVRAADEKGKASVGEKGRHRHPARPSLAGKKATVGLRAAKVEACTSDGELVCEHRRAYGAAPTDTGDPAAQLATLAWHPGAWESSLVRASLPDGLREHMDSLGKDGLRAELRIMRDRTKTSGWTATLQAVEAAFAATGRVDEASVAAGAARATPGAVEHDVDTDLSGYDEFMGVAS